MTHREPRANDRQPTLLAVPRWTIGAIVVALAFEAAGCGCGDVTCDACIPALTIRVSDAATGERITNATISPGGDCDLSGECSRGGSPGPYSVTVSAPGYEPATTSSEVLTTEGEGCCSCGYESKTVELTLTPASCAVAETVACRCPSSGDPSDDGAMGERICGADGFFAECNKPDGPCQ